MTFEEYKKQPPLETMDLLIFMCHHWQKTHEWMKTNYPENINSRARMTYPVIQGFFTQQQLKQLAKHEFSSENCKITMQWIQENFLRNNDGDL